MRLPWRRRDKAGERPPVVLGTQMAAAIEAEKRPQTTPRGPSPFAVLGYDLARGELDLFRFVASETDDAIAAAVETALANGADGLTEARAALTQDDLYTLLTYCRRRALA